MGKGHKKTFHFTKEDAQMANRMALTGRQRGCQPDPEEPGNQHFWLGPDRWWPGAPSSTSSPSPLPPLETDIQQ